MVQLLLDCLGGDRRRPGGGLKPQSSGDPIQVFHVDSRFSDDSGDIGRPSFLKLFRLLGYCCEAICCRWRHGVRNFLYVPAPGLRSALYRDWLVMALCRPFFKRRVYYWQAAGLGDWLETEARFWERWISGWLLAGPALSIVLGDTNRRDGVQLKSGEVRVVPNSVADPCPDFSMTVAPRRRERAAARARLLQEHARAGHEPARLPAGSMVFRALFMSLCHRSKGLFDAIDAVARINERLGRAALRVELVVAGKFWKEAERQEFEERIRKPDLQRAGQPLVAYRGFVSGQEKAGLLLESDCLCFPSYYEAESFPVVLVEAMACGLPVITTRWRMLPELLPAGYPGLVNPRSPEQVAEAMFDLLGRDEGDLLRRHYLENYSRERYAGKIVDALLSLER